MTVKVRKQIDLEPDQEARLREFAVATGMPEAEIIRQALDRHLYHGQRLHRDRRAWAAEQAYLAQLVALGPVEGRRSWQREDLYERGQVYQSL